MEFLFKTEYEQAYGMGHELYLFKKTDKNSQDFKLYNLGYINSCNEPVIEIMVKPKESLIQISSFL